MKKRTLFVLPAVVMLVLSLILSGCGGGGGQAKAPSQTKASSQAKPASQILLGAIVSLTGSNTMTGADQKWAYEQAVADINASGGVDVGGKKLPIKLVEQDDQSTVAGAAAAAESLIKTDGCTLLLSSNVSPLTLSAATVAEKYKVYMAANTCMTDQFAPQHLKWTTDMFFSSSDAGNVPFQIFNTQPAAQRPKKIAIMMMDNSDGQSFSKGVQASAKKNGYSIALNEQYVPGSTDFSSSILKMKNMGIDAVLWDGSPTDSIVFVRQLNQLHFKPKYVGGWMGFWPQGFQKALGKEANYIVHDGFWSSILPYPGAAELGKKYVADHKGMDSVSVGLPYATVQVVAQAITKAGSTDSQKVRDAVWNGDFSGTVMGELKFDNGICSTPSLAMQWYNGKRELVYPFHLSKWSFHWYNP